MAADGRCWQPARLPLLPELRAEEEEGRSESLGVAHPAGRGSERTCRRRRCRRCRWSSRRHFCGTTTPAGPLVRRSDLGLKNRRSRSSEDGTIEEGFRSEPPSFLWDATMAATAAAASRAPVRLRKDLLPTGETSSFNPAKST